MKCPSRNCIFAFLFVIAFVSVSRVSASETAVVLVRVSKPGPEISPAVLGLSYEMSVMLPDSNGVRYFRPDNKPLVNLFRTIGVKSLRIGGNSVDAQSVAVPSTDDLISLFEFAKVAGVKVIYSVRLQESESQSALASGLTMTEGSVANVRSAAKLAKFIHDHYADLLDCFAIGNEPYYFSNYSVYSIKWKAIRNAILVVYPGARFCGPDQNPEPKLDEMMVREFGGDSGRLAMITQHSYPFGCSYKNPDDRKDPTKLIPYDAAEAREKMLSPTAYKTYDEIYQGIKRSTNGTPIGFRLSETNSYWFSGLKGASDSFASALWVVDYIYWWAEHGAEGLNFHTGDRTGGELSMISRYSAFVSSGHGYEVRPIGYGIKLFDLGGLGKLLPVSVSSARNMVAYATLTSNRAVSVTLINKAHGAGVTEQKVHIELEAPISNPDTQIIFLKGGSNGIAGSSADVTLGGAPIDEDGNWQGTWTQLPVTATSENGISVTLPPASAAIVKVVLHSSN